MSCNGSFSRIPVANICNRDIYTAVPRSTLIKEDMLLSYAALKSIKSKSFDAALAELKSIIKVYNENVAYINHSNQNRLVFEAYTYEQYRKDNCNNRTSSLSEYNDTESKRQHSFLIKKEEEGQISQLVYLFPNLTAKITRAVERLKIASPNGDMPELTLTPVFRQHCHDLFAPSLRRPVDEDKPKTTPIVEETPPPIAPKIDVTALCALSSEQTLGICCAPEWEAKPISFTKSENGWKGEVPGNTEWKFVILEKGQVTRWEQHDNRNYGEQTPAFTISAEEISF